MCKSFFVRIFFLLQLYENEFQARFFGPVVSYPRWYNLLKTTGFFNFFLNLAFSISIQLSFVPIFILSALYITMYVFQFYVDKLFVLLQIQYKIIIIIVSIFISILKALLQDRSFKSKKKEKLKLFVYFVTKNALRNVSYRKLVRTI